MTGNIGISTTIPLYTLDVSGVSRTNGLIVGGNNAGLFGNITSFTKTYAYFQQINSTISSIPVVFNFSNTSNYVKIIAMAMEKSNSNNISTIVIEATGGQMFSGTPINSMNLISNNLGTNGSFPWSSTVTTGLSSVTITTSVSSSIGYYFNFRIETFGGTANNIFINGVNVVTFNY